MRVNLVADNGDSYCGSVRSVSHNAKRGSTKVVFIGGISKFFKDVYRVKYQDITFAMHENKNIKLIKVAEFECILEENRLL